MYRVNKTRHNVLAASMVLALGLAGELAAQDTTSAIRGRIIGSDGAPVANATVVVTDARSGNARTLQSNSSGAFFAPNLTVGGPYTVTVNDSRTITVESIALGDVYNLAVDMGAPTSIDEVVVVGSSQSIVDTAPGPAATFNSFDMLTSVAFNRDIRDVYALDPRINLSGAGSEVNCGGRHPRFNSVSLDGISQNDRFGLNSNGYSTATGMPFPYEAVAQVSVELAPFDVTYGGFTACNINAVTKSGNNEWTGTAFYEMTNENLRGDSLSVDGSTVNMDTNPFDDKKYGFSVGGPILENKLFFYAAYEETEAPSAAAPAIGYAGSGNGEEKTFLSADNYNRIIDSAQSVYDYDPGGMTSAGAQEEKKYVVRLDWNINDNHDLMLVYNYYDGFEDRASDRGSNIFAFSNHSYTKGAESKTSTVKLRSQWSNNFSTELFYSKNEMNDSQITKGPRDFAEMQISFGSSNTVYLGADDSRQSNALSTESEYFKALGKYLLGEHVLTFGYEREALDIFNMFVQHSRGGEYRYFDDSANDGLTGLEKFELGLPDRIYYGSGGGTNNPADAAASFENILHTYYVQDEYYFPNNDLTVTAGLRYERFASDDRPAYNPAFNNLAGLRNDGNVDGLDLLMPRLGFTWQTSPELSLRGGLGLYSGGNPTVWLSNAWSNDGLSNVQLEYRRGRDFDANASVLDGSLPLSGSGRPGYDVPLEMYEAVANTTADAAASNNLVLIDPNYEQPAEWKLALGGTYNFANGLKLDVDLLHGRMEDSAYYVDVSQDVVGHTAAGQPIYDYVRGQNNFMLTNADATASSSTLSFALEQSYDWGLDWMFGYAFTEAEDISPMTSSVAASNYTNTALYDLEHLPAASSNYLAPHRFTGRVSYGIDLIPNHETRVTLMYYSSEGQPQSYVMSSGPLEGDGFNARHLLYVPSTNDANVLYGSDFDQATFNAWVDEMGLSRGGFVERNSHHAQWSSRVDLRIDQEIPAFAGSRGRAYLRVYNLLNMIDDEWGHQYDAQFFPQTVVDMTVNNEGQYVFERFNDRNRSVDDLMEVNSLWQVRLGLQFEF